MVKEKLLENLLRLWGGVLNLLLLKTWAHTSPPSNIMKQCNPNLTILFMIIVILTCCSEDKINECQRVNDSIHKQHQKIYQSHQAYINDTIEAIIEVRSMGIDGKNGAKTYDRLKTIRVIYNFTHYPVSEIIFAGRLSMCQGVPDTGVWRISLTNIDTFRMGKMIGQYLFLSYPPDSCRAIW